MEYLSAASTVVFKNYLRILTVLDSAAGIDNEPDRIGDCLSFLNPFVFGYQDASES